MNYDTQGKSRLIEEVPEEISPSSGRKGECEYRVENLTGKSPGSPEASQGQGGQEAGKQADRRQTDRQENRASGLQQRLQVEVAELSSFQTTLTPNPEKLC